MSKPVTNEEVEDVLSSIRRLVSEDKRPLAGLSSAPREPAIAEVEPQPGKDRLVLTPALRVADTPSQDSAPLDLGSVARETWLEPENEAENPAGAEEDVQTAAEQEPDAAMQALDALVHETLEKAPAPADEPLEDGDYSDEGYWDDTSEQAVSDAPRDEPPEADLTEDETTDHEYAEFTPEEPDFGDDVDWDDGLETAQAEVEEIVWEDATVSHDSDAARDDDEEDFEPTVNFEELRTASTPLKATIAALGAAIGKTREEWEPDGDEADALASADVAPMSWEDDVQLDARGAPLEADAPEDDLEIEEADTPETPIGAAFGGDDQVMDEEALRDLVSEIVRSELQGALGERITRNVRKLVRREIHRALTAQEME